MSLERAAAQVSAVPGGQSHPPRHTRSKIIREENRVPEMGTLSKVTIRAWAGWDRNWNVQVPKSANVLRTWLVWVFFF